MSQIQTDLLILQKTMPAATITVKEGRFTVDYEVKFSPPISEKEHEALMPKIREIFYHKNGNRLIERFTEETGIHFHIYVKKPK
jgi:hypothetical protein